MCFRLCFKSVLVNSSCITTILLRSAQVSICNATFMTTPPKLHSVSLSYCDATGQTKDVSVLVSLYQLCDVDLHLAWEMQILSLLTLKFNEYYLWQLCQAEIVQCLPAWVTQLKHKLKIKMRNTHHSFHVGHVRRRYHGLDHELVFALFIGIIVKRLQHNWKEKKNSVTVSKERETFWIYAQEEDQGPSLQQMNTSTIDSKTIHPSLDMMKREKRGNGTCHV